jgi:hypothetical protein
MPYRVTSAVGLAGRRQYCVEEWIPARPAHYFWQVDRPACWIPVRAILCPWYPTLEEAYRVLDDLEAGRRVESPPAPPQ